MLVIGENFYLRNNKVAGFGYCQHCGKDSELKSYTGYRIAHVYWIPLIPLSLRTLRLMECSSCKVAVQLAGKKARELEEQTVQEMKSLLALRLGGESSEVMEPFYSGIETIFHLGHEAFLEEAATLLVQKGMTPEGSRVEGILERCRGNINASRDSLNCALEAEPDHFLTRFYLAESDRFAGDFEGCRTRFEELHEEEPGDAGIVQFLLQASEVLGDKVAATEYMGKLIVLVPRLQSDKAFMKRYKKACKSAGVEPSFQRIK